MKKNQTKEDKRQLEKNLTSYFEKAARHNDSQNQHSNSSNFEKDKVYANVMDIIEARQKKKPYYKTLKIAASLFLMISVSISIYFFKHKAANTNEALVMLQESAPKGKVIKISLADGTIVFLNAGSTLSFPKSFTQKTREVSLKGEGFFKVAHDQTKPFIIHTDKINTQVLGTSFNINAYEEYKDIKVTVVSGKVAVYNTDHKKENTSFITANQQVVYNKEEQTLNKSENIANAADLVAWTAGKMIYKNQNLSDVILAIEKHYNIDIKAQAHLQLCKVTVNFDNASLEKVLKVISKLVEGEMKYENGTYFLTGKGC